jgi:carboxypeptidase C (cathepsin A)
VFWTNGGPGCSGLIGFLTEQGPFRPTVDGEIQMNPYAWNKIANMVFLEQPIGVGFSYSDIEDDYRIGDDQAAKDNLATILGLIQKFPHFAKNDLYITSESYGGHYMPTLADEIVSYNEQNENKLNFKGFAVGNPYTDYYSGVGAEMETYWGKQLLPKPSWDKYVANGCLNAQQQLNNSVCSSFILDFMKKFIIYCGLQKSEDLEENDLRNIYLKDISNDLHESYLNLSIFNLKKDKQKLLLDSVDLIKENINWYESEFNGLVLYSKPQNITNDVYQDLYNYISEKASSNLSKKYNNYYDKWL